VVAVAAGSPSADGVEGSEGGPGVVVHFCLPNGGTRVMINVAKRLSRVATKPPRSARKRFGPAGRRPRAVWPARGSPGPGFGPSWASWRLRNEAALGSSPTPWKGTPVNAWRRRRRWYRLAPPPFLHSSRPRASSCGSPLREDSGC
jgi:hypothetical protein